MRRPDEKRTQGDANGRGYSSRPPCDQWVDGEGDQRTESLRTDGAHDRLDYIAGRLCKWNSAPLRPGPYLLRQYVGPRAARELPLWS